MRRCSARLCPILIPDGTRYCPQHQAEYEAKRGTPGQRGYDTAHRKLRSQWHTRIDRGARPPCTRCGKPIEPFEPFDLDHDDNDRRRWLGPAHQHCNRSAGGQRGATVSNQTRQQ